MSDEEPDYLSDDFLAKCISAVSDVRPSLLTRHSEKRKHEQLKTQEKINAEHRKKNKSIRHLEEERREEGLKTAIGEDNKGYQMLQKMGFKPGTSIGLNRTGNTDASSTATTTPTTTALREPIPVVIKTDRKGFGGKTKMEEKRMKIEEWKKMQEQMGDTTEYRSRIQERNAMREVNFDLRKAQSVCKNLDVQKSAPLEPWFWPPEPKPSPEEDETEEEEQKDEEEAETESLEPLEKLEILTKYLRKEYIYCIWCGATYDDEVDLRESCPGNSRQDH